MNDLKKILVCPLDWGLGHAARCIPLIKQLCERGHYITVAASGAPLKLLQQEFPQLEFIDFPGYNIIYPRSGRMTVHLFLRVPSILKKICKEHRALSRLLANRHFDVVISDNRYGLWNKNVYCIFITHQIMIKCPPGIRFMEPILYRFSRMFIRPFNECWIPDVTGEGNLSGDLSHKYPLPINAKYIGWLSRFASTSGNEEISNTEKKYDVLAIISGPEPQRSLFEQRLIDSMRQCELSCCIIRGTPGLKYNIKLPLNIEIIDHASTSAIRSMIKKCNYLICRPGYSTLMDLMALNKNTAILVPTPGQTEQEYLAENLKRQGLYYSCGQDAFDLAKAIDESRNYRGFGVAMPGSFFSLDASF